MLITPIAKMVCGVCFASIFFFSEPFFETVSDIPPQHFKEKKEISGWIVKITDGDTFRFRHSNRAHPGSVFVGKLTEHTIPVRIAAVDTPEIAKFGKEGQAYSVEARDFTEKKLLGKKVTLKLLSKDQYGRVIGLIGYEEKGFLFGSTKKDISEELLKEGLALVYRQGGAQYDGAISRWNSLEERAVQQRKGIWKNGRAKAEKPADFKKKLKTEKESAKNTKQSKVSSKKKSYSRRSSLV